MKFGKILSVVIVFLVVALGVTTFIKPDETVNAIVLTASTFLFSIFIGFSISDRHNRINELRRTGTVERANLQLISKFSSSFGNPIMKKITNLIEDYLISNFDYKIWDYGKIQKEFDKIGEALLLLKPKNPTESTVYARMLMAFQSINESRVQATEIISERLSKFEWSVHILLSAMIIFSLILLNTSTLLSLLGSIILSLVILLLIYFLFMLDSLNWKNNIRIIEPYERTLENIGKERYYTENMLKQTPKKFYKGKIYRLAKFNESYSKRSKKSKTIELIKN